MKKWQNRFEYVAFCAFSRIIQSLPPFRAVKFGRMLGAFVYYFVPIRRAVVFENIQRAFPNISNRQQRAIARGTFITFGQNFVEFVRTPKRTAAEMRDRVIIHNAGLLQEAYESGKGTLLLTAHFGNWEIMGSAVATAGFPLVVIARRQRNRLVDEMINTYRRSSGMEVVPLGMGIRDFLRALRGNKFVALLADQDAHSEGVFVDFFAVPSATAAGPALLALRTGADFIFGTCTMRRDGRYNVIFEKIRTDDLAGASEENVRRLTQRHVALLEDKIRRRPDHWFWMHRRWKTPPPLNYRSVEKSA